MACAEAAPTPALARVQRPPRHGAPRRRPRRTGRRCSARNAPSLSLPLRKSQRLKRITSMLFAHLPQGTSPKLGPALDYPPAPWDPTLTPRPHDDTWQVPSLWRSVRDSIGSAHTLASGHGGSAHKLASPGGHPHSPAHSPAAHAHSPVEGQSPSGTRPPASYLN